jgi:hypothetical protein
MCAQVCDGSVRGSAAALAHTGRGTMSPSVTSASATPRRLSTTAASESPPCSAPQSVQTHRSTSVCSRPFGPQTEPQQLQVCVDGKNRLAVTMRCPSCICDLYRAMLIEHAIISFCAHHKDLESIPNRRDRPPVYAPPGTPRIERIAFCLRRRSRQKRTNKELRQAENWPDSFRRFRLQRAFRRSQRFAQIGRPA